MKKKSPQSAAGSGKSVSVGFISLGCAKNLVDSQNMAGVLVTEGVTLARCPEEADVVIVNTCAFIEAARAESLASIRDACLLKRKGRCRAVLVTGCFPQRDGARLKADLPEVDAFIGVDQIEDVGRIVRRLAGGETGILDVSPRSERLFEPRVAGLTFTGGPFAYLKIAEGCDHRCAFCAIPGIRGNYRSRPVDALVREAESLLARGVRELNLVSQDTTAYGRDLEAPAALPDLLDALGRIGGRFWIRLLYGYPSRVDARLLERMAAIPQVCPYLDIPIQHSHPEVLRAMRRADTVTAVAGLAARIRAVLPEATLRTTCLVGFPGETDAHFAHLLEFLEAARFDHVGVFAFSPEAGTPALGLPGQVPPEVAEERCVRLMETQKRIVDARQAARIGSATTVLLEQPPVRKGGDWLARSMSEGPGVDGVIAVGGLGKEAAPGRFVKVRFTRTADYDMKAVALAPPED